MSTHERIPNGFPPIKRTAAKTRTAAARITPSPNKIFVKRDKRVGVFISFPSSKLPSENQP
jgi:hypothetical protein